MTATPATLASKLRLRDTLRAALRAAAQDRDLRPDTVRTDFGLEPAYVGYERQVMLAQVNAARAVEGRPAVTERDIARIEQHACGHYNYADKYALLCAELVLGQSPWPLEG